MTTNLSSLSFFNSPVNSPSECSFQALGEKIGTNLKTFIIFLMTGKRNFAFYFPLDINQQ